jgi:hypothetical protein
MCCAAYNVGSSTPGPQEIEFVLGKQSSIGKFVVLLLTIVLPIVNHCIAYCSRNSTLFWLLVYLPKYKRKVQPT